MEQKQHCHCTINYTTGTVCYLVTKFSQVLRARKKLGFMTLNSFPNSKGLSKTLSNELMMTYTIDGMLTFQNTPYNLLYMFMTLNCFPNIKETFESCRMN